MQRYKQLLEDLNMEKAVTIGSAAGVVFGCLLIPFTDNPGLAIGMSISFGAAVAMIIVSIVTDINDAS